MNESISINDARFDPAFAGPRLFASTQAALLYCWGLSCGLLRGLLRVSALGAVTGMAFVDAAIVRWTSNPAAAALARSRAKWFHHWSRAACRVLGLDVERHGFVPVSGLVVVDELSLVEALMLASVAPFVFVMDTGIRRRPILGWVARLAGTLFRDRRRRSDVPRINFLIERALRRRQLVVVARTCTWLRGPVPTGFPSALLQPVVDSRSSLTACVVLHKRADSRNTAARVLTQPRSRTTIAFHPPAYHHGDRKQLAGQLRHEIQMLETAGIASVHRLQLATTSHSPAKGITPRYDGNMLWNRALYEKSLPHEA